MEAASEKKYISSRLTTAAPATEPPYGESQLRSSSARLEDISEARNLHASAEKLLRGLIETDETTANQDLAEENRRLLSMAESIRASRKKLHQLEAALREKRRDYRGVAKKNVVSTDESILSLQRAVRASERDGASLEKMLKKAIDPQYSVYLYNKLQRLESEVTSLSRENKNKDGANNRVGRLLEGEAKGSECVINRLLKERENLTQEICIQSERNTQLKMAVKRSETALVKVKERYGLLKEKFEEVLPQMHANHLDTMTVLHMQLRRGSSEIKAQESKNAALARTVAGLNLKRHNMHREFERQITELRGHMSVLTKEADALSQKHFRLKIEASRLTHHIQENLNKLPASHKPADATSPTCERENHSFKNGVRSKGATAVIATQEIHNPPPMNPITNAEENVSGGQQGAPFSSAVAVKKNLPPSAQTRQIPPDARPQTSEGPRAKPQRATDTVKRSQTDTGTPSLLKNFPPASIPMEKPPLGLVRATPSPARKAAEFEADRTLLTVLQTNKGGEGAPRLTQEDAHQSVETELARSVPQSATDLPTRAANESPEEPEERQVIEGGQDVHEKMLKKHVAIGKPPAFQENDSRTIGVKTAGEIIEGAIRRGSEQQETANKGLENDVMRTSDAGEHQEAPDEDESHLDNAVPSAQERDSMDIVHLHEDDAHHQDAATEERS